MNRLLSRWFLFLVGAHLASGAVIALFAPRLLLLDESTSDVALSHALGCLIASLGLSVLPALLLFVPQRRDLAALAMGGKPFRPKAILKLASLPVRAVAAQIVVTIVIGMTSLVPGLRPSGLDGPTQVALVLMTVTVTTVALVFAFVLMRSSVRNVLRIVPQSATTAALNLLPKLSGRVRRQLITAAMVPVVFVGVGALLLVFAHVRAVDVAKQQSLAAELVQVGLEPLASDDPNATRAAVQNELTRLRMPTRIERRPTAALLSTHDDDGSLLLTVPVGNETATVLLAPEAPLALLVSGLVVILAAMLFAAALASYIGTVLGRDLRLATSEVKSLGAASQGTRILDFPHFREVSELLTSIGTLGGVFRDFAQAQIRAIEARASTERMRGMFLAAMSHDLKAPLNAVLGFTELVGRGPLTDGQRESLLIIEQRGRELLVLIETILDSARIEAGQLDIAPETTMVGDIVMSAVLDTRELTAGTGIEILAEVQPGVPKITVDSGRIVQALRAILLTAVRFAGKGTILLRATVPAHTHGLRIDIEASGGGVSPEERDKVFDAFKNAERARRHGSLGLGLSLAKAIAEIHGGDMTVAAADGDRVVFRMLLPLLANPNDITMRASRPFFDEIPDVTLRDVTELGSKPEVTKIDVPSFGLSFPGKGQTRT